MGFRSAEIEGEHLETIGEHGKLGQLAIDDCDPQVFSVIVLGQEPRSVRVFAIVRPEGKLVALGPVIYDYSIADLSKRRPTVANDRSEQSAGKLAR